MERISWISVLYIFCSLSFGQSGKGYEISVTINGLSDSTVFLAYHLGDKQYLHDTLVLDRAGRGVLSGPEPLPQGIYMIVLPERRYFEILISSDQYFAITCSYINYFKTLKFTGSDENSAFINYQRKWVGMQEQASKLNMLIQGNMQNNDSLKILNELRRVHENEMKGYLSSVVESNKGTLLALLVNSIRPVETPAFIVPPESPNPDSLKWIRSYLNNKDHFFDNIDLTDERLLRTPVLYTKLNTFFSDVVIQLADSINKEIDIILKKCAGNYKVFQFVAVFLFNHFRESEIMGHDAVMVKLTDDIYLSGKADWTTPEWRDDLRKQVDMIRPNLIGKKAQNLVMDSYKGIFVSLYDIEKEFTILYFWEPECGHCREATPKLKAYYDAAKNEGIEVFTVCTQPDKAKWEKYIKENSLTWINAWDPQRTSHFDYYYNIQSTPYVYILDRDKTIIAKKIPVENIGSFIENYRKYHR